MTILPTVTIWSLPEYQALREQVYRLHNAMCELEEVYRMTPDQRALHKDLYDQYTQAIRDCIAYEREYYGLTPNS